MPSIERAGATLFYEVRGGSGPTVLALHPLLTNEKFLDPSGLAERLVGAGFRLVLPVSIGHKPSGCPLPPSRYALAERVADVLAVADAVGTSAFGLIGYSMGTWIGTGLLDVAPDRVRAAALGGWDPIDGILSFGSGGRDDVEASFPQLLPSLASDPVLGPSLTDFDADALTRCAVALFDDELPSLDRLETAAVPLTFFCGVDDPYRPNMLVAAEKLRVPLIDVAGDHIHAFADGGFVEPIADFFERTLLSP